MKKMKSLSLSFLEKIVEISRKHMKFILVGSCSVFATAFLTATVLLWIDGWEKYWITNQIDFSEALVYFGVGAIAFVFTVLTLTTLFNVLNFKRDHELSQL